jgi:hypothetical protein
MYRVRTAATPLATLAILAVSAFCVAQPPAAGSADLDAIRHAWKARKERCERVRLAWSETAFVPKGHFNTAEGGPDFPLQDTLSTKTATLLLSGVKLRYQPRGGMLSSAIAPAEPTDDEYVSAFDGKLNQLYFPPGTRGEGSATLQNLTYSDEVTTTGLKALLSHFRGHSLAGPLNLSNLVVTPRRGDVNGRACIITTRTRPADL